MGKAYNRLQILGFEKQSGLNITEISHIPDYNQNRLYFNL